RVDPGGPHDARQDRVALVRADVLGALELDGRLVGAEPDDHVDRRVALDGLGHTTAPEGADPGDQHAPAHQPNHTLRRSRSMSWSSCWMAWRIASEVSMMRLRE